MKTRIRVLIFISALNVIIVFALTLYTPENPNYRFNSFQRKLSPNYVHLSTTLDLKHNSYYIAGATDHHFYFGNAQAVRHILRTNADLSDTAHVEIFLRESEGLQFRYINVKIDSPYFYFLDGSAPAIFRGLIGHWTACRYTYDKIPFMESVPISNTSFIIRTTSSHSKEFLLGKHVNVYPYLKLVSGLLEKQIDGKFCVDGMLHYSDHLQRVVYVYYYRNQFICTDSSLNLLYRGKTIDTVSRAQIKVSKIKSNGSITMSAPPLLVNKKSCVSENWLFVNSNLLANNENKVEFENSDVVDVYDLGGGLYQFSFYLPKYKGQRVREFKVFGRVLIALYGNHALKYELTQ